MNMNNYQKYYAMFSYELSEFQKISINAIVDGNHSLITAHTGSGKTLPAEFAILYFTSLNKKVIYTSPLKALSNQKLSDFRRKYPNISFGILTGDIQENPTADVLIMTTEILRNTLFRKKFLMQNANVPLLFNIDFENELGCVCFDEVHYFADIDRGAVWEQTFMLLPKHIQYVMMSATINNINAFANWIETITLKKVIISSTAKRVVPLTHYMWHTINTSNYDYIIANESADIKNAFNATVNKLLPIVNNTGKYDDTIYYKVHKINNYMVKNNMRTNNWHVMNELIKYLNVKKMLPAICFVFSKKLTQQYAEHITESLLDVDNDNFNVMRECRSILFNKLGSKMAQDIMVLNEYTILISALTKGIAYHHAGMLPILRELVELLFEKNYIKLLFATETFAVGINLPTKTVIFTALTKYTTNELRLLHSYEYNQMSGRAGRRGIDTIGNVILCTNLFTMPTSAELKTLMTGPPISISSQFKISYELVLNALYYMHNIDDLILFIKESMSNNELIQQTKALENDMAKYEIEAEKHIQTFNTYAVTSIDKLINYIDLTNKIKTANGKKKAQYKRDMDTYEQNNKNIRSEVNMYNHMTQSILKKTNAKKELLECNTYVYNAVQLICDILESNNFIEKYVLTPKGICASMIKNVHGLLFGELYHETNYFDAFTAIDIVSILSCFTDIKLLNDAEMTPKNVSTELETTYDKIKKLHTKFEDINTKHNLDEICIHNVNCDIMAEIITWCNCTNEQECIDVINDLETNKKIYIGDFTKAILKINNLAQELETVCNVNNNVALLYKIKQIPEFTLKHVITNISLYI